MLHEHRYFTNCLFNRGGYHSKQAPQPGWKSCTILGRNSRTAVKASNADTGLCEEIAGGPIQSVEK